MVPAHTDHAVAAVSLPPNSGAIFSHDRTFYSAEAKPDLHALPGKGAPAKAVMNAAHGMACTLAAAAWSPKGAPRFRKNPAVDPEVAHVAS